ncbi:MAG: ABC transporter ATP-binding protein [Steroidobacteraceae bacterium]|nr:ABC transporter ATP-binding protein [Steroidobacteraceae bacterium]
MSAAGPLLAARALAVRGGARTLVEALELELASGEFLALLGRNGSGKTLLLHTLAGLRPADAGEAMLGGDALMALPRREAARRLALLPQDLEEMPGATVLDAVLTGRYAHQGAFGADAPGDLPLALQALRRLGIEGLAARELTSLSGGEQRRAAAAATLAQQAPVVLLDEPTNHLDPHHQLALLEVFAAHARDGGAVLASLHDPTLAARYADRVLLLHGDGRWECGRAAQLLNAATLSALYLTDIVEVERDGRRIFAAG